MKRTLIIIAATFMAALIQAAGVDTLRFSNEFQCGSIGSTALVSADSALIGGERKVLHLTYEVTSEKDPLNPVDTLLAPSSRWFYFMMTGTKDKVVTINLIDTDPAAPVYSYDNKNWMRYDTTEILAPFSVTKFYERDTVFMAYYIPYTNDHLEEMMQQWQYTGGVSVFSIGKSYQGRDMKMMVISSPYGSIKGKKRVYIHGRVHPSETPCSWCLEGLIEALLAPTPYARALRENAVFYILPFNNPDGVALGRSRCDAIGVNMEINYGQPDSLTRPEVKNIKKFIETTTYGENYLDLMLNFHSQIFPANTYWVHSEETTSTKFFLKEILLTSLTTSENPIFSNRYMSFSKMAPRYIEGWFWDNAGEHTLAITHETSYSYYNNDPKGEWVTIENLKKLGERTLWAISDFLQIENPSRIIVHPFKATECEKIGDNQELIIFGKHCYMAQKSGATVTYRYKELPAGEYDVMVWKVGRKSDAKTDGVNCWEKLYDHTQNEKGLFNLKIQLSEGELADAVMLRKKN